MRKALSQGIQFKRPANAPQKRRRSWRLVNPRLNAAAWVSVLVLSYAAYESEILGSRGKEQGYARQIISCSAGNKRTCVLDGDTIQLDGQRIRLADIDAPEIFTPRCESEAALGQRAKERLVQLLNEGSFEIAAIGGRDMDRYGRKLRVVRRDGKSLGSILVAEGLARPWEGRRRSWCA